MNVYGDVTGLFILLVFLPFNISNRPQRVSQQNKLFTLQVPCNRFRSKILVTKNIALSAKAKFMLNVSYFYITYFVLVLNLKKGKILPFIIEQLFKK